MMLRATVLTRSLLLALISLTAACEDAGPPASTAPATELVWPAPPMTPRIRFIRTVSAPQDVDIDAGWFDKFVRALKGPDPRRTTQPFGLHRDADGRLYVVDGFHKAVQVFASAMGDHYWFPEDPPENFINPIDIVGDDAGRVYVSDSAANVVHVFDENGTRYVTAIGKGVLGRPTGLALDPTTKDLYVVDTLNGQVVVFDAQSLRSKAFIGRDGSGREAFHFPTSIAFAPDGHIYVSDSMNFRIQVLKEGLEFERSFGSAGDAPGYFSRPKGIAVDSDGNVYVVDALFDNVQIFDREGRLLLAFGKPGANPGEFWLPTEIFIDSDDRIYVSDSYNQRIQIFQYLKEGNG